MTLRAGALRHTVILQAPSESRDGKGAPTTTWSNFATRSAAIDPMGGRERFEAAQHYGEEPQVIRLRYLEGVTPKMRALVRREHTMLATGVNDAATQFTVADDAGTHAGETQPFRVQVGAELMEVTGGHGTTTWTVTRGVDGTVAASHATGADVWRLHVLDIQSASDPDGLRTELHIEATEET